MTYCNLSWTEVLVKEKSRGSIHIRTSFHAWSAAAEISGSGQLGEYRNLICGNTTLLWQGVTEEQVEQKE